MAFIKQKAMTNNGYTGSFAIFLYWDDLLKLYCYGFFLLFYMFLDYW